MIHSGIQEDTTVEFIVDHMSCHERQANKKSNKNKQQNKNSNNRNNSRKRSSNSNQKGNQNKKKSNPCKIPGHNHEWSECPKNKFSKNYNKGSNNSHNKSQHETFHTSMESSGSNEAFRARINAAVESYQMEYGGRTERSIDGDLVWLP
mmetsp:Transcript_21919/g.60928  ORF Transcript_21919/g.60928 Transcript_21919/m.60928 type:complete len:149 (+) Transcript_21919:3-449(+)